MLNETHTALPDELPKRMKQVPRIGLLLTSSGYGRHFNLFPGPSGAGGMRRR